MLFCLHISNNLKNFIESETIVEDPVKCSLCPKCRYKFLCEGIWDNINFIKEITVDELCIICFQE